MTTRVQLACVACGRPRLHAPPHPTVCPSCGTVDPWKAPRGAHQAPELPDAARLGVEVVDVSGRVVEAPGRIPTGYSDADELLGGGLVRTRLVVLAGARGSGKTRWLRRVTAFSRGLYFDVEETADDHALRCREELPELRPADYATTRARGTPAIDHLTQLLASGRWPLVAVNSFQKLVGDFTHVQQAASDVLLNAVQSSNACLLLVSQMNALGEARGSKTVEHDCHTLLLLTRQLGRAFVKLTCPDKNRDGDSTGYAWYRHSQRFEEVGGCDE